MFIGGQLQIDWKWFDCDLVLPYLMWYEHNWNSKKKKIREKECSRRKYINPSINGIRSYRPRFSDVNYHTKVKYQSDMFGAFEQWDDRDMRYTNSW